MSDADRFNEQFAETEDERNERLAAKRRSKAMTALTPTQIEEAHKLAEAWKAPLAIELDAAGGAISKIATYALEQTAKLEAVMRVALACRENDDADHLEHCSESACQDGCPTIDPWAPLRQLLDGASLPSAPAKTADEAFEEAAQRCEQVSQLSSSTLASIWLDNCAKDIRALKSPATKD